MYFKTLLISLIIAFLAISNAPAQGYTPLPDSNATWNINLYSAVFCPPFGFCYSKSFSIIKDTLIGNYVYHLTDYIPVGTDNYISAYRQNLLGKKAYFPIEYPIGSGIYVDTLLFDYAMNVGDSIIDIQSGANLYFKVLSIDSIYNGSLYLRRFNLGDQNFPTAWVYEGIGNEQGLFGPFFSFESTFQLICMVKNNQSFYPYDTSSCFPVGINENNYIANIMIYPNVANSNQTIKIASSYYLQKYKSVKIVDMSGNQRLIIESVSDSFSIVNFKPGVYIVLIENENGVTIVRKLIVL